MWKTLGLVICVLVCALVWTPAAWAQESVGGVTVGLLNVRTGPDTGQAVIAILPVHTRLVMHGRDDSAAWVQVQTEDGVSGWAATAYIEFDPGTGPGSLPVISDPAPAEAAAPAADAAPASGEMSGTVLASLLTVRQGPSTAQPEIGALGRGASVVVEGRDESAGWILVHTPDEATRGWVSAQYVKLPVWALDLPVVVDQVVSELPADVDAFVLDGNEPVLANNLVITIDDCSIEENVRWAYNALKAEGLTATFFPNTRNIMDDDPQLWRDIVAAGMEIGYHTRFHMSGLSAAELDYDFNTFTDEIRQILGDPSYSIRSIRPPRGVWDSTWLSWAANRGLYTVKWNIPSRSTMDAIAQTARNRATGGSIILMHTGIDEVRWLQNFAGTLKLITMADGTPFRVGSVANALDDQ